MHFISSHPVFLRTHFDIILPSIYRSTDVSLSFRFVHKNLASIVLSAICAIHPAHLILPDLTILIILWENTNYESPHHPVLKCLRYIFFP
jgi:hypothetical protein